MNYLQAWEKSHYRKIAQELTKTEIPITKGHIDEIIEHTSFRKRSQRDKSECPYYEKEEPCHETEDLNCLLCACPNYESEGEKGGCKINSPKGKIHKHQNLPQGEVWDCNGCSINHSPDEVRTWLEKNIDYLGSLIEN